MRSERSWLLLFEDGQLAIYENRYFLRLSSTTSSEYMRSFVTSILRLSFEIGKKLASSCWGWPGCSLWDHLLAQRQPLSIGTTQHREGRRNQGLVSFFSLGKSPKSFFLFIIFKIINSTSTIIAIIIIEPAWSAFSLSLIMNCVTRAPLLYFIRSWVALSFKAVSGWVGQGSVTPVQISILFNI